MDHRLLMICIVLAVSQVEAQNYGPQPNQSPISGKDGFSKLNETIIEGLQEIVSLVEDSSPTHNVLVEKTDRIIDTVHEVGQQIQLNISQQLSQIHSHLNSILQVYVGTGYGNPARSCTVIKDANLNSTSGYYWIQGDSQEGPVRMFCDMTRTCNGVGGGWMKVTKFDVRYSDQSCPSGLRLLTDTRHRCAKYGGSAGCGSTTFPLHGIGYQKVCGKIIGYQDQTTDAFAPYHHNHGLTIDGTYVDGVSLTLGHYPRRHIWTFASAHGETQGDKQSYSACPCSYRFLAGYSDIPSFVGNDYFCDSGRESGVSRRFFTDPLWNGAGCSSVSSCCSFNNPPWFRKTLPSITNQDIEMRLCHNQDIDDEDVGVESVELYVQ